MGIPLKLIIALFDDLWIHDPITLFDPIINLFGAWQKSHCLNGDTGFQVSQNF